MKRVNRPIRLFCLNYNQCDPRKCSAIKLRRLGLLKFIHKIKGSLTNSIILNPLAPIQLSYEDRDLIQRFGLIVLDCSWKRILQLKESSPLNSRKLPALIAANSVNYGKWEKLSSAEAIAAALFIAGFKEQAKKILSKFRWGNEFWKLNKELLEKKEK